MTLTATGRPTRTSRGCTRLAACLVAGVLASGAAALMGCGSADNGVASKSPQEILAASMAAVAKASSVTIRSQNSQGPLTLSLGLKLTRGGGQAAITGLGASDEVIRIGDTLYTKGSGLSTLYKKLGISKAVPPASWVKLPTTGQLASLTDITELVSEVGRIITPSGSVTKGPATVLEGQPVIELKTEGKLYKGSLYVKSTGEPYPVKLVKHGSETGTTTFTGWNSTPAPVAPARTISAPG
jgi:hypothetical protein